MRLRRNALKQEVYTSYGYEYKVRKRLVLMQASKAARIFLKYGLNSPKNIIVFVFDAMSKIIYCWVVTFLKEFMNCLFYWLFMIFPLYLTSKYQFLHKWMTFSTVSNMSLRQWWETNDLKAKRSRSIVTEKSTLIPVIEPLILNTVLYQLSSAGGHLS